MFAQLNEIEQVEDDLETWLVENAEQGVPEVVPIAIRRDYADDVERLGFVTRLWGASDGEAD